MPTVHLDGVCFAWSEQVPVLNQIHLHLSPGWTGLTGENGSGKSTLLALIAGALSPSAGRVRRPEGATIALCPQRPALDAAITRLASRDDRVARRVRGQLGLDASRLEPDLWSRLSGGEAKRWQVGAALAEEPDVLLVDEPTNHLDREARDWVLRALRAYAGIGLLVSHDRDLLDALTTRTLRCHRGQIQCFDLPYSPAREAWEAESAARDEARDRLEAEARRARRQLQQAREIQSKAEASRSNRRVDPHDHDGHSMGRKQLAAWGEAAASRTVARRREALDRAQDRLGATEAEIRLGGRFWLGWNPCPRPMLTSFRGELRAGDQLLLTGVDIAVGRRDRLWLTGRNGTGKTTLLRALLPQDPEVLYLPQVLPVAACDQDLDRLRRLPPEPRGRALQLCAALGCPPERLLATRRPSPGEARKLRLALGLAGHVWGLFLDEPSNDLDLPSIERIEAALADYPGAIVLVGHDARLAAAIGAAEVDVERWRGTKGKS